MKLFLLKIVTFILIPMLVYSGLFIFLKNQFEKKIEKFPIVILGDSQTKYIQHPQIFNYSIEGSPYFVYNGFVNQFAYQLKGKKIYVACNYHNFSKLYQNRFENEALCIGWRENMLKHLDEYCILNHKHSEIRPKDMKFKVVDIKKLPNLYQIVYKKKQREDNSLYSVINDTMSIDSAIQRHWTDAAYVSDDSIQRAYLKNLVITLKQLKCDIVLLKMPLTNYYTSSVPLVIKKEFSNLSDMLGVRLLDLNDSLSISKNYKYFKDYGHLNKSGDSLIYDYFMSKELLP